MPEYSDSEPEEAHTGVPLGVKERLKSLGKPLPACVVFDLDFTLWGAWVDTHVSPPLKRKGDAINKVVDRYGQALSFYPHVPSILLHLRNEGVKVAAASRTSAPTAARQTLNGLVLSDDNVIESSKGIPTPRRSVNIQDRKTVKAISLFNHLEIYPGSKLTHFKSIHADTGVRYEDMLFFDDETRNSEVGKLGVHFQLVGHEGTDVGTFEKGVREWRAKMKAREGNGDPAEELLTGGLSKKKAGI